ncbi:D-isomer specific 2-hydroxyacid dehydrogenase [Niveomyces insectorum RCEF 264]|uniref:D-isomer specific 2-hydroxyacid dehydrogenase n=1 Tax=Niveomyces insectorum RCEF 264 TaxID=1081102 RepID=A0A167QFN0_9HYPO|nr:D-isomer specific 2-hydroxyacid dehydrogenase [Niveomyces insectorum RCEF 264]
MANTKETLLVTLPFEPFLESYEKLKKLQPGLDILHYKTADADIVPPDVWGRATIHLTHSLFARTREQVPRLRWVYLYSGGINQALHAPLLHDPTVHWTRNSGVHAPQIAEWTIAMLLAHFRQVPQLLKWQASGTWHSADYRPRSDLLGRTIAFLGYGAIARHTARIAAACGMRVLAYTLHPKTTAAERRSTTFTPAHTGDPDGTLPAAWYHGDLDTFLAAATADAPIDALVVALPSTDRTRQAISRAQLARLRGCYVINVARGDIIHTNDLVEALNNGVLAGAALDVTDPEPLPEGHPLWTAKNTIVTPHISGVSDEYMPRTIDILHENLTRLHEGRPLINQIQRSEGY